MAPQFDPAHVEALPWHTGAAVSWDPVDAVPLEEDPVGRAIAAAQSRWDQPPAISVLGDDGRWRSVDLTGLTALNDSYEYHVGINEGSISPDGTTLAIGQPDAVILVDLDTGEQAAYAIPGLGPEWHGRQTYWSADGSTVYVAQPMGDARGFAVNVRTGGVTRTPFEPSRSAFLDDVVVYNSRAPSDTNWAVNVYDATNPYDLVTSTAVSRFQFDSIDQTSGYADLWAGRRIEVGWTTADPRRPNAAASGVQILDDRGYLVRLLPVKGWGANGGGGRVLGWLDVHTVVFAVYESEEPGGMHALAWNITTDQVTRLADFTWTGATALAPPG